MVNFFLALLISEEVTWNQLNPFISIKVLQNSAHDYELLCKVLRGKIGCACSRKHFLVGYDVSLVKFGNLSPRFCLKQLTDEEKEDLDRVSSLQNVNLILFLHNWIAMLNIVFLVEYSRGSIYGSYSWCWGEMIDTFCFAPHLSSCEILLVLRLCLCIIPYTRFSFDTSHPMNVCPKFTGQKIYGIRAR